MDDSKPALKHKQPSLMFNLLMHLHKVFRFIVNYTHFECFESIQSMFFLIFSAFFLIHLPSEQTWFLTCPIFTGIFYKFSFFWFLYFRLERTRKKYCTISMSYRHNLRKFNILLIDYKLKKKISIWIWNVTEKSVINSR